VKLQPRVAASGGKSRDEVCVLKQNMYTTNQMFEVRTIVLKKVMFLLSILKNKAFSF